MTILKQRATGSGKLPVAVEWVFPRPLNPKQHIPSPIKAWARVTKAAKLPDVRIHDLRRTAGSWMAATGANLSAIGKSLGHRTMATTAIYARLQLDGIKGAVDTAAAAMQQAMKPRARGAK